MKKTSTREVVLDLFEAEEIYTSIRKYVTCYMYYPKLTFQTSQVVVKSYQGIDKRCANSRLTPVNVIMCSLGFIKKSAEVVMLCPRLLPLDPSWFGEDR